MSSFIYAKPNKGPIVSTKGTQNFVIMYKILGQIEKATIFVVFKTQTGLDLALLRGRGFVGKLKLFVFALVTSVIVDNAVALTNSVAAEDNGWNSVAQLRIPYFDDETRDVEYGFCNATLLNNKTIITAAHCFGQTTVQNGDPIKLEIGRYNYIIRDGKKIKTGYKTTKRHESTGKLKVLSGVNLNSKSTIPPELDIAIFEFDSPIELPSDFVFPTLYREKIQNLSAPENKPTVVSINVTETISHNDTRQLAGLNKVTVSSFNLFSTSNSRVSPGDSGAPLFAQINGKTFVIGVVKGTVRQFGFERDVFTLNQGRL